MPKYLARIANSVAVDTEINGASRETVDTLGVYSRKLRTNVGSAGDPTHSFFSHTDSGMYTVGGDIRLASNGTNTFVMDETDVYVSGSKVNGNNVISGAAVGTLDNTHDIIRSTGTQTITLPLASSLPGKLYIIVNTAAHTTTINRSGSDTINDTTTTSISLLSNAAYIWLRSDGVDLWMS